MSLSLAVEIILECFLGNGFDADNFVRAKKFRGEMRRRFKISLRSQLVAHFFRVIWVTLSEL